jgi:predicted acetyltransferase
VHHRAVTQTLLPTGLSFRTVAEDSLRGAHDLFLAAVHNKPASDELWDVMRHVYAADRTFGAFDGDRQAGTATSLPASLTVPGGAILPMTAVTFVGVRSDYRRRGALTGMMRAQLEDAAARGEVFAGLHASEPVIYGRFGYGPGTIARDLHIRSKRARLRQDVPVTGTVRLLDVDEVVPALSAAYPAMQSSRAGLMGRTEPWWALSYTRRMKTDHLLVAAHFSDAGDVDGWVAYKPAEPETRDVRANGNLYVLDFQAADQVVANSLWHHLVGVDLVEEVVAYFRPVDDPVEMVLDDAYAVRDASETDLWLRIVDVPAALAARTYGMAEPVVVEVVDPLLPGNSGRYRIGPQGTEPTTSAPALTMGADTLAMLYLGAYRPSVLAGIGRITVADAAALPAADRLFAVDQPPWNGSMF